MKKRFCRIIIVIICILCMFPEFTFADRVPIDWTCCPYCGMEAELYASGQPLMHCKVCGYSSDVWNCGYGTPIKYSTCCPYDYYSDYLENQDQLVLWPKWSYYYTSFSLNNFRPNFQILTGDEGIGMQAHHVFPQTYKDFFDSLGINIHYPHYGSWIETEIHQGFSYEYNQDWYAYIYDENIQHTKSGCFAFARSLAGKYDFTIYF